jgi:hypothetical protein
VPISLGVGLREEISWVELVDLEPEESPEFQMRTSVVREESVFGSELLLTVTDPETLAEFRRRSTAVRVPRLALNLLKLKVELDPVRVGVWAFDNIVD